MDKKLIFVIGGARSGKSNYAIKLAKKLKGNIYFVATASALDKEMEKRINGHKVSRPKHWKTIEEGINLKTVFKKLENETGVVILDCLTFFISNLLMQDTKQIDTEKKIKQIIEIIRQSRHTTIIVSNEVGLGIVPDNKLARKFRDIGGRVNQLVAEASSEVYFMISGVPIKIK